MKGNTLLARKETTSTPALNKASSTKVVIRVLPLHHTHFGSINSAMKRALGTTTLVSVASGAVCAPHREDACPCFTAAEYDKIFESNPQFGCHFTGDDYQDIETISLGVAYVWPHYQVEQQAALGVVQAAVTVREINGNHVEGGVCAVVGGQNDDSSIKNIEVRDYGDGSFSPEAFQDCVDIMRAKCQSVCNSLENIHEDRYGCGRMLFPSTSLN